jgi:hypothetical protein
MNAVDVRGDAPSELTWDGQPQSTSGERRQMRANRDEFNNIFDMDY